MCLLRMYWMLFLGMQLGGNNGVKTITGEYVGTGDYGKNNPIVIKLDFEPLLFFIMEKDSASPLGYSANYSGYWWKGIDKLVFNNSNTVVSASKDSITLISDFTASDQFNNRDQFYTYFALGY